MNAHHVIPRGSPYFGDDVRGNLLGLCGSGTRGCHGAFHGTPYLGVASTIPRRSERRDREWVARRIGRRIDATPEIVTYVIGKLGDGPGREYLRHVYYVEL